MPKDTSFELLKNKAKNSIKLALITPGGETVVIVSDVREFNLSKPIAQAELAQAVDTALAALSVS
jgi:hypothetical protein